MTQPWPSIWFDDIDSTNEEAKRRANSGETGPCWIAARRQTAGRGRLGRSWVSPEGNLHATALFLESGGLPAAARAPFYAALAAHDMLSGFAPRAPVRLKWPNDLRVGARKLCGVLVEAGQAGTGAWVAVGVGANIAAAPEGAGQAAVSLADLEGDASVTAEAALSALAESFARRIAQARASYADTLSDWRDRAEGLGEIVRVRAGAEAVEGRFEGLDADGAMVLSLAGGGRRVIRTGEVELVKERV